MIKHVCTLSLNAHYIISHYQYFEFSEYRDWMPQVDDTPAEVKKAGGDEKSENKGSSQGEQNQVRTIRIFGNHGATASDL